jgi:hypothetical protein
MSIFQLYQARAVHVTSMKLLALVAIIAAVAGLAVISHEPVEAMPDAGPPKADSVATEHPQQKSWSDEWYEIQKAMPDNVAEDVQAF